MFTLNPNIHIVDNNYNYSFTFKQSTEFGAIIMKCVDKRNIRLAYYYYHFYDGSQHQLFYASAFRNTNTVS